LPRLGTSVGTGHEVGLLIPPPGETCLVRWPESELGRRFTDLALGAGLRSIGLAPARPMPG